MLHIINKSPSSSNALANCLRLAADGDAILLIEDGVLAALVNTNLKHLTPATLKKYTFFVLKPDIEARGIIDNILPAIKLIDYDGFVELTLQYHPIQSWS